jgi:hypothetical protein
MPRYYATIDVWIGDVTSKDEAPEIENRIASALGDYQNTVTVAIHEYPTED